MKSLLPDIHLSKQRLVIFLSLVFAFNLLFLAGTWVFQRYYQTLLVGLQEDLHLAFSRPTFILLKQFDLSSENVAATWYSSMLLLLIAVTCTLCFFSDKGKFLQPKERVLSYGWVGLAFIFATLSLDELGSFHETIGDSAIFGFLGSDIGWYAFYVLIGLVGLYMVGFGLIRLRSNTVAFVASIAGALFFLSNPFQEYIEIDSLHAVADPASWQRPIELLLLEEGTEIFGSWCFLLATLAYMSNPRGVQRGVSLGATVPVPYARRQIMVSVLALVCVLGLSLAATLTYDKGPKNVEDGILENWFPSALPLLVSLYTLYHSNFKTASGKACFGLAFLSIGLSAFYGSNIYEHFFFWGTGLKSGLLFRGMILVTIAAITLVLWNETKFNLSRIALVLWAFCLSAAFLLGKETSLQLTFFAYSLLAVSFASYVPEPMEASPKASLRA